MPAAPLNVLGLDRVSTSAEFSYRIPNPLGVRNHTQARARIRAQAHNVPGVAAGEVAVVCLWGGVPMAGVPKVFLILFNSQKL